MQETLDFEKGKRGDSINAKKSAYMKLIDSNYKLHQQEGRIRAWISQSHDEERIAKFQDALDIVLETRTKAQRIQNDFRKKYPTLTNYWDAEYADKEKIE